jgi:hypothetical protein
MCPIAHSFVARSASGTHLKHKKVCRLDGPWNKPHKQHFNKGTNLDVWTFAAAVSFGGGDCFMSGASADDSGQV